MQSYVLAGIGLPCGGVGAFLLTFMCLKTLWCSEESGAFLSVFFIKGIAERDRLRTQSPGPYSALSLVPYRQAALHAYEQGARASLTIDENSLLALPENTSSCF